MNAPLRTSRSPWCGRSRRHCAGCRAQHRGPRQRTNSTHSSSGHDEYPRVLSPDGAISRGPMRPRRSAAASACARQRDIRMGPRTPALRRPGPSCLQPRPYVCRRIKLVHPATRTWADCVEARLQLSRSVGRRTRGSEEANTWVPLPPSFPDQGIPPTARRPMILLPNEMT